MNLKKLIGVLWLFAFISLAGCHILHKSVQTSSPVLPEAPTVAHFPTYEVPLPATNLYFLFPKAELTEPEARKREITTIFSTRDRNEIRVKDPKLFANGSTEIIDLSFLLDKDYEFPLPGAKVISPYRGKRKNHSGVDLKTRANDTIYAAFDGVVRFSKPYAAYGNFVIIRHYNGLETLYSHNSKNLVASGDAVKAGHPIALTGRTGRATTEHLHFEIRINGEHFNPDIVFDMAKNKLRRRCLVCTKKGNNVIVKSVNILPHQSKGSFAYAPPAQQ